ncbi:MAG: Long-chain-fatty-acid--CoA ligase [uncultured Friedmanniella sp.]|uniref:Long-chain-fatty-acid--CoA ligase n=1 Tax=uncultured Friedmanniella sp. TaxID=335381 RepID=A0A6J4JYW4_9ACTN|nr:long-chain fatty acid--CoA ligase [uncultured Friedmanniella sp.]CAA9291112.1 MAG: Long-chain-fatty-acid--CoA ligase [uncultured Friedmanniella sp.]
MSENPNIAVWVADRALSDPHLPAIKQGDTILSYAALDGAASRFAGQLASRGVRAGDRVALIMPNVAYFPIAYYAILRLGAIVVPMNPLLKAGEIAFTWRDCGARLAVVFPLFAEEAQQAAASTGTEVLVTVPQQFEQGLGATPPLTEVAAVDARDTAVILYTSGTTGQPKGAELSHANLRSNTRTTIETLMPNGPGDVLFGGLPLFHSFGQTCGLNAAMAGGACLALLPKFDGEEALRIVHQDRVTIFLGVPTMYMALLGVPDRQRFDTTSVRVGASGGASLPVQVLRSVEEAFGFPVLEGYGLSETSPVASFNHPDAPTKPGSVGTPIRGVEFALHDASGNEVGQGEIGEIVIRGENVMKGYWNRPEETAEVMRGGWFHTGDLATRDADGFYFIVDRLKDLIIRNGFNVYPREVEEVLYTHPAVAEAAVFGIPDPTHGEEVAALVTLKEGADATPDQLRDFVADKIAAYKYPRVIRLGPLPKGPTGKILKREIRFER